MNFEQSISPSSIDTNDADVQARVPHSLHAGIRVAFGAYLVASIVLCVTALVVGFGQLRDVCSGNVCHPLQLTSAEAALNNQLGLSLDFYAGYVTFTYLAFCGVSLSVAALIYWYRSDNWMGLFAAAVLTGLATGLVPTLTSLTIAYPEIDWLVMVLWIAAAGAFPVMLYVFPDGRFVPGWSKWLVITWIIYFIQDLIRDPPPVGGITTGPPSVFTLGIFVAGGLSQIYRFSRSKSFEQRQQTKWALMGFVGHIVALIALVQFLRVSDLVSDPLLYFAYEKYAFSFVGLVPILFVPLSIALSILRYRLWDVDVIINRALVYAILTISTMLLYAAIVGGLSIVFHRGTLLWAFIATGIVAVSFQAIHQRIQQMINRLMYGHRDEPYVVLDRLTQELTPVIAVDEMLPALVRTIADTLQLPYVAIALRRDGRYEVSAETADNLTALERTKLTVLPLVHRSETIGQLRLAPRRGEGAFSTTDLYLLDSVARQSSIAAYNVRLTTDLQRSREEIVATLEEERRRLRRDLHDGLGPMLAVMSFRLDEVINVLDKDRDKVRTIATELKAQVQASLSEIRRIAYGLRPPSLDELGLVGALREHLASLTEARGPEFHLRAPDPMPELSAAVEVAAYHIAIEAITNTLRHSGATNCNVSLSVAEDALCVEIRDDGRGLPQQHEAGVGLSAMRERAVEVGGTCTLTDLSPGTRVQAILPSIGVLE